MLGFVPTVCLAGWQYIAEGSVSSATTFYESDAGLITGFEGATGPLRVIVSLPSTYVPGSAFGLSDEVVADIDGPGNFNFRLDQPMEGSMPLNSGPGSFLIDTGGDTLGFIAPGPFLWAVEFECLDRPPGLAGNCLGYTVTGELGEFNRIPEPPLLGALSLLAVAAVAFGFRDATREGRKSA